MGLFQELIFTAFLAIILGFIVAKVVGKFAVSNSSTDCNNSVCSVDEGAAAKEATLNRELRVGKIKSKKRVRFVDDEVVIKRVDHYEGSENLVFCEDVNKIGDDGLNEDFGGEICKEQCFDMREMQSFDGQDKGCEKMDWGFEENEKILEISKIGESVILEEERNEVLLESENSIVDQNEGNGLVGSRENEGLNSENSCIDLVLDTKECGSCHISSDVDHDSFVGSREDKGLIEKNPSIDSILNDEVSASSHISTDTDDVSMCHNVNPFAGFGENEGIFEGDVKDENVKCEDDDWEGIERSELEKVFAEAVNYVEYGAKGKAKDDDRLAKLGSDVQMQLYGLHKVAVEGACYEPQPMALKVSARAKWNSWQRLGTTSREVAMEQYMKILEDNIPGWMINHSSRVLKLEAVEKISVPGDNRTLELNSSVVDDISTKPSSVEKLTAGSGDSI